MSRQLFKFFSVIIFLGAGLLSCSPTINLAGTDPVPLPLPASAMEDSIEVRNLDTMVVTPGEDLTEVPNELPVYRATTQREMDLLHTSLDLSFDWEKETVLGKATLTVTPYFFNQEYLNLDAKGFQINEIKLVGTDRLLSYEYDDKRLQIKLDRTYTRKDTLRVLIDYTAHPTEGSDGSDAITSDQGLFFINADGSEPSKPRQIWTQGETEFNSRWFPTIDKPNERTTQEVFLTVEDTFETLSNGLLVNSINNENGTRTDHWVMDMPHAPYLFMIAVGDFAVVEEEWEGLPVSYYVEHPYAEDATSIFGHTPEMLSFFSELTGFKYPWQKYAQIVVRDYVSGAMENTTSVIFGEFVQKHKRGLIDNSNDYIVAHELIHHWFGDYVTCESWSNLVLNEGFANYGEYLWMEHKYGLDEAENHRMQELQGYMYQASQEIHPLVDFKYQDKEDMFDQHSYNKGGLVLHMLRKHIGDEAFFASLNTYLKDNALQAVEVHDLRLAFEKTTGLDLNWFFNQWFLSAGHPVIEFSSAWDETSSALTLTVKQTQDPSESPAIFRLPTEIDVYFADGSKERLPVELNAREQQILIPLEQAPVLTILDPERIQLGVILDDLALEDLQLLYQHSNTFPLRQKAVERIAKANDAKSQDLLLGALEDAHWAVRRIAISGIDWNTEALKNKLTAIATDDHHSLVRADALYAISELDDRRFIPALSEGINQEDAYPIVAASIRGLYALDPELAMEKIKLVESDTQSDLLSAISTIYAESGDTTHLAYFDKHMSEVVGLPSIDFYQNLEVLLEELSPDHKYHWLEKCAEVAKQPTTSPYTRIAATRTIVSFMRGNGRGGKKLSNEQKEQLQSLVEEIIATEQNDQVKSIYRSFMGS